MGALTEWGPPAEDENFYNNIVRTLDELYPDDWRQWVINTPTYEDLFGEKISSDQECRLRFAIPTVKLAKAYCGADSSLSERRYKRIKRILLKWPLGRALIYTPLNITAKIHPVQAFNKFLEIIPTLKPYLISRHEASKLLRAEALDTSDIGSNHSSINTSKRSHSPNPQVSAKLPRIDNLMAQQNLMLEKICQMVQTTNENMNAVINRERRSYSPAHSQTPESSPPQSNADTEDTWVAPPLADPEEAHSEEPLEDFAPGTKESEAKISTADKVLVEQGISCQRFNSGGWANIRYADVQKLFQATPAFTALKVNSNLAAVTPNWQLVSTLEKMDLCLGAITHGLLQQRQAFQNIYLKANPDVKGYISKHFLAADATFRKTSDALLQYTCGKRAEVIQQRRGLYKPTNRTLNELLHSVPPSENHLFAEPNLADFVKEQGGISKLFPGKFRKNYAAATANRNPTRRAQVTVATPEARDVKERQSNHFTSYKPYTGNKRPEKSRFPPKRAPQRQNKTNRKF